MNEQPENWLTKYHDAMRDIRASVDNLRFMEESLNRVGLFKMSGEIANIVDTLDLAGKKANAAVNETLTDQVKAAEEMSGSLLKTALAGIEMGRKEKEGS